jgi:putative transposase
MGIFCDEEDYSYFESLIARALSAEPSADSFGRKYKSYSEAVELYAYCLMPNHFHLLLKQKEKRQISQFMTCVVVSYGMYFNKKYKRQGPLFESRYKSVVIDSDVQLKHLSRYIHLNPVGYRLWDHSSYGDYVYEPRDWVNAGYILDMFSSRQAYIEFVDDYEDVKRANDQYKTQIGE